MTRLFSGCFGPDGRPAALVCFGPARRLWVGAARALLVALCLRVGACRALLAALVLLAAAAPAAAYGPEGHLVAGRLAEARLCPAARAAVAELGRGQDLGELGLWADRVRGEAAYRDSGPWHYMNIAEDARIAGFVHPPEGDVLWAIGHFAARLTEPGQSRRERADALRFLVHFVVDIHQPLHVGRAEDRGGNAVELRYRGETTNLHRFWDTHAIEQADLPLAAYQRAVAAELPAVTDAAGPGVAAGRLAPAQWAAESLALRAEVYAFDASARELPPAYLEFAERTTRARLALAAARLAATLNSIYCR